MRRVILEDVIALARALQSVDPALRSHAAARLIKQAHMADKAQKRGLRGSQPGDLASHAQAGAGAEWRFLPENLECLAISARAIAQWKRCQGKTGGRG